MAAKAAAFAALADLFPGHGYATLSGTALMKLPAPALSGMVALNYVDLVLILSGTADIAIALARLYGWNLPVLLSGGRSSPGTPSSSGGAGDHTGRFLAESDLLSLGGTPQAPPERDADLPGQRAGAAQRVVRLEVLGDRRGGLARPVDLLPAAGDGGVRLPRVLAAHRQGPRADRDLRWSPARLARRWPPRRSAPSSTSSCSSSRCRSPTAGG